MKKTAKLTVIFLLIASFALGISAAGTDFTYDLINPITYAQDSEEEQNAALLRLKSVTQAAIDAFITDRPLESMWLDVAKTHISYSVMIEGQEGSSTCTVTKLKVETKRYDIFTDPKGMTDAVADIVNGFTPSGSTAYDRVKSIHDYVCSLTEYDAGGDFAHNAFGVFIDGKSVCEGYAKAFKLLCDSNGIPCILISGNAIKSSSSEGHMWNYVRMDDGKWYAVDVTWDDAKTPKTTYFLVGENTQINKKAFSKTHVPEGDISRSGAKTFDLPKLSAEAYEKTGRDFSKPAAEKSYYYNQLDDEQKMFFDNLMSLTPPEGKTPFKMPDTTVTEDTIAEPETTKEKTTTAETTTAETTEPMPVTTDGPVTSESEPRTTTAEPEETPASVPSEEITSSVETSDKTADSVTDADTENFVPDSEENTQEKADSADGETNGSQTGKSDTAETAGKETDDEKTAKIKEALGYGLKAAVIVFAIIILFVLLIALILTLKGRK